MFCLGFFQYNYMLYILCNIYGLILSVDALYTCSTKKSVKILLFA